MKTKLLTMTEVQDLHIKLLTLRDNTTKGKWKSDGLYIYSYDSNDEAQDMVLDNNDAEAVIRSRGTGRNIPDGERKANLEFTALAHAEIGNLLEFMMEQQVKIHQLELSKYVHVDNMYEMDEVPIERPVILYGELRYDDSDLTIMKFDIGSYNDKGKLVMRLPEHVSFTPTKWYELPCTLERF